MRITNKYMYERIAFQKPGNKIITLRAKQPHALNRNNIDGMIKLLLEE